MYLFTKERCNNIVVEKHASPNTQHVVAYSMKDCDLASGSVNSIELDNILIFRAQAKNTKSSVPFRVVWINNNKISIETVAGTEDIAVFKKPMKIYGDIEVVLGKDITNSPQYFPI